MPRTISEPFRGPYCYFPDPELELILKAVIADRTRLVNSNHSGEEATATHDAVISKIETAFGTDPRFRLPSPKTVLPNGREIGH